MTKEQIRKKAYYQANKEEIKARNNAYYHSHKEQYKQYYIEKYMQSKKTMIREIENDR